MAVPDKSLAYAVRPRVVAKHLGDLLVAVGVLAIVPLVVTLAFCEFTLALPFAGGAAAFVAVGLSLRRLRAPPGLQRNEALTIAALAFVLAPLASWPAFAAAGHGWLDALFEAVSGITTTGMSTLASFEDAPRSFLFARAWAQWYGGLGIVVVSLALMSSPGFLARRLEPAGAEERDLAGSTRVQARRILYVYLVLTVLGMALLALAGIGLFPVVAYTLGAVSTGGFAPHDASLAALDGWIPRAAVIFVSSCGAVALPLYYRAWRRGGRVLLADPELRVLVACAVITTALLALDFAARDGWAAAADAPLLGFSAQTTTGFTSVDVGALDPFAKVVIIVSMLLGGCVGSTAGGVKVFRLLLIGRLIAWSLRRLRMPDHAVSEPRLGGDVIEPDTIRNAAVVVALFAVALVVSWLPFLAYGHDPLDALFEVASALGTVGLSAGVAGPQLEGALKGILCLDMLLGRLEIVAIVVLLTPATWIGRRTSS